MPVAVITTMDPAAHRAGVQALAAGALSGCQSTQTVWALDTGGIQTQSSLTATRLAAARAPWAPFRFRT
jgi:hypothetical protein